MKYFNLDKIDTNSDEFQKWNKKAKQLETELEKCSNSEERKAFFKKNPHWNEIKGLLKKTYGNLCWYSDCDISGSFGDVDHFRPKSLSRDISDKGKGDILNKDGYWQLAYDYHNYRISCEKVNRSYGKGGKSDCFPVKDKAKIGNISEETPLLLDPCNRADTELIGYREGGEIFPETEDEWQIQRVKKSQKIYNLGEFIDNRKDKIGQSNLIIYRYINLFNPSRNDESIENDFNLLVEEIKVLLDPKKSFSSVAFNYLMFRSNQPDFDELRESFQQLLRSFYTV